MKEVINRVAMDLNEWRKREGRFEDLFPGKLNENKPFLKEKLKFLDTIQAKYGSTGNEEERLTLRVLKQERDHLSRILYPSLLVRSLRKILLPVRGAKIKKITGEDMVANSKELTGTMARMGFPGISNQLEQNIQQGANAFNIDHSYYVSEKERMDYNFSFVKSPAGYQLDTYTASLSPDGKPSNVTQQVFSAEQGMALTPEKVYNLLSGRYVQHNTGPADGTDKGAWIQLDFNDKDNAGNFKIKTFPPGYGYDLLQGIKNLPLKEYQTIEGMEVLIKSLAAGNRQEATLLNDSKEQKIFLEANPQSRSINIFDGQLKKTSLSNLLSKSAERSEQQEMPKLPLQQRRKKGKRIY